MQINTSVKAPLIKGPCELWESKRLRNIEKGQGSKSVCSYEKSRIEESTVIESLD
jgi:hypothetical protein